MRSACISARNAKELYCQAGRVRRRAVTGRTAFIAVITAELLLTVIRL